MRVVISRKNSIFILLLILLILIGIKIKLTNQLKFNLQAELNRPDLQLNESVWGYPPVAFPRASMIDVEYHMPDFQLNRTLSKSLGSHDSGDWSQDGQSLIVDTLLNGKENGFYVEVGADDGENFSNSLFFEVFRRWSGILIEPNQESFAHVQQLNRKALLLNTCVSPSNFSEQFTFVINPFEGHGTNFLGGLADHLELTKNSVLRGMYEAHFAGGDLYKPVVKTLRCSPLVDLIPEYVKRIDYLSLDTEGSELQILKSIRFQEILIDIISIDVSSITGNRNDDGYEEFLKPLGYKRVRQTLHDDIYQLQK